MNEYFNLRRVCYGADDEIGIMQFIPVCEKCRRFIKRDKTVKFSEVTGLSPKPNAYCKKCGRTRMIFEGFF